MSHFSIIAELYNLCNNFFSAYWPLRDTNPRNAFSTCFRGSITWWPHPVQRMRISIPTRLSSHALVPHGCDFFILITSPTFKSIHSLLIATSTSTMIFYPASDKLDNHHHLLSDIGQARQALWSFIRHPAHFQHKILIFCLHIYILNFSHPAIEHCRIFCHSLRTDTAAAI